MKDASVITRLIIICFVIVIGSGNGVVAQEQVVSKDLRSSWTTFNKKSRSYEKVSSSRKVKMIKWTLTLPGSNFQRIEIEAPEGTSLIINGKYWGLVRDKLILDIDSLKTFFKYDTFEFTVYRNAKFDPSKLQTILYGTMITEEGSPIVREGNNSFQNFFVSATLIILLFIGFLAQKFPRDTSDYFSFTRSLSFKNREETLISSRPFNRINILYIILNSLIIGFLIVAMIRLTGGLLYFPFVRTHMDFSNSMFVWIGASSIVFMSFLLKYVLIKILSGLFRLGDFRYIQHFNSLRFSFGSFLIVFLLVGFTYLTFRTVGLDAYVFFIRIVVFLFLIRILVLFFKLRDFAAYRDFHLFSYLCGTELIPFIILYKLILG